ncbi:Methyltransferase-like protein 5 [Hypsibius exemplaris]|uniref:Methyltransferase-like protein 5 n=1 Tax=Hypsibius exemplaris TaxID=2072580 RepID=A0A1W0X6M2_HYPEX|nr:Methyltransferase-like protein 5 [Hypsibius exemplaris]
MKLKELESRLQDLTGFDKPRIELEQYETQPHLAARILYTIEQSYGDIAGKMVADLGCGPGRLTIGSALLDADFVYGLDIDPVALKLFTRNSNEADVDNVEAVLMDVTTISDSADGGRMSGLFDTVILNPPFGTKGNKGIDVQFLQAALRLSSHAVYSFHKTTTREYLMTRAAKDWDVEMSVVAEMKFDLPQSYARHKRASVDVAVDLLRTVHRTKTKENT